MFMGSWLIGTAMRVPDTSWRFVADIGIRPDLERRQLNDFFVGASGAGV